jgi:hypothetical protein
VYEANYGLRQIFMDGRKLPGPDAQPWWYGYSVGRWDGDTLVIDTVGFNGNTRLDTIGHPHSDALHMIQTFQRTDAGHIAYSVTIDDPKAYTKPWTVTMKQVLVVDTELVDEICLENEKSTQRMLGK